MTRSSKIDRLWREHLKDARSWVRGSKVAGVDLDLLDANTCQCVLTYIDSGALSGWKTTTLQRCSDDLDTVIDGLEGEVKEYFERLRGMARLVLSSAARRS
jgi:hypothetical protein